MRKNHGKENHPVRTQGPPDQTQAVQGQQQNNLQGYINPPTMQQWNRQGNGNVIVRDMAVNQNLCFRCGLSGHMTRDCDVWNQRNLVPLFGGNTGTVAAITQGMDQLQAQLGSVQAQHQSPPGILRPTPMPNSQSMDNQGFVPAPKYKIMCGQPPRKSGSTNRSISLLDLRSRESSWARGDSWGGSEDD